MKKYLILIFLICFKYIHSQELSDVHPLLTDKYYLNVGVYGSSKTAGLNLNTTDSNSIINFNESYNLRDHQVTFFINVNWRLSKKSSISAEYFSIRNNYDKVLTEEVEWDDVVFKEGSNVEIDLQLDMYRIFVGRAITKGLKHELGVGVGIHTLSFNSSLQGEVSLSEDIVEIERKSVSFLAPLPNVGLWCHYTPNPKLGFSARFEWFSISIGDYGGSLWNVSPSISYQLFKNFGLGLSYKYFDLIAKVNNSDWDGKVKVNFRGPLFSISANF